MKNSSIDTPMSLPVTTSGGSVKRGAGIDTVMNVPSVPGLMGTAGVYNEGPIGGKGVDGGIPLKFTDGSIARKGDAPIETTIRAPKVG